MNAVSYNNTMNIPQMTVWPLLPVTLPSIISYTHTNIIHTTRHTYSLEHLMHCLLRPHIKSPQWSHHDGFVRDINWKLCPRPNFPPNGFNDLDWWNCLLLLLLDPELLRALYQNQLLHMYHYRQSSFFLFFNLKVSLTDLPNSTLANCC